VNQNAWRSAALAVALGFGPVVPNAHAGEATCGAVTRDNVVRCALAASLSAEVERREVDAAAAREDAARPLLPSNPVVSGWAARRSTSDQGTFVNWSATLAQEIEIGGQRGERRRAAAFGRTARTETLRATERDAAADAWHAYFDALGAADELRLAERLEATGRRVADAAEGAAARGLIAGVDADVAGAALVRIQAARTAAEQRLRAARAALASLLGRDPRQALDVEGPLEPLAVAAQLRKGDGVQPGERPEVRALVASAESIRARAELLRRTRVPSPTVSAFVEQDGFHEHVLGVGLSVPIPLPHPLGRTYAGDIAEAEAEARATTTRARRLRRDAERDVAIAVAAYDAAEATVTLHAPERLARAEQSLSALAAEVEAGRLGVRDAIVAQEALVQLLASGLAARRELCLASVDLARAAGIPLERGER
jgi:outer membrane protein, heavy metal efflux system